MCGISALIGQAIQRDWITAMNDQIKHRGPNGEGFFFAEGLAFGHRRLSIIDLSEGGHQPMTYQDRYTLTYNGEIYNYQELRQELIQEGHVFHSQSDTEVILAAYAQWGKECLKRLNGMWAFALYDAQEKIVFCSRDRLGVKPFYYTQLGNLLAISSEIKQLTVLPGWQATLNVKIAQDFLLYGLLNHTPETFFENVFTLPGGHSLSYSLENQQFQIERWYELPNSTSASTDGEDVKQHFYNLFEDSIRLRLRSDVKVGSCLSGGLDSSSIVCVINQLLRSQGHQAQQETVSSCFENKTFDEQPYMEAVIEKTQVQAHKVFPQFGQLFSTLDQIIWHQDQPFGSTSIFAQWNVYKAAKEHDLTVMLDGQGADEYLSGYHSFYPALLRGLWYSQDRRKFWKELNAYRHLHRPSYPQLLKMIAQAILPNWLKQKAKKTFKKPSWWQAPISQVTSGPWHSDIKNLRDFSKIQLLYTSLPGLLHYQDRDSMAFSVESREPFLDYRLVEFVLNLPDHYKIQDAKTKWILRQALVNTLPKAIVERYDKMGFVTPESVWIKQNKALFRHELETAGQSLGQLICLNKLLKAFDRDIQTITLGSIYWRLICLGRWIKVFKVETHGV